MSEVNGPKISVNQLNFKSAPKQGSEVSQEPAEQTPQLTDFSNSKAEALGRSMLFKGTDSTKNDLKALIDNHQIADNSDELFEAAYKAALASGSETPYEDAAAASTTAM